MGLKIAGTVIILSSTILWAAPGAHPAIGLGWLLGLGLFVAGRLTESRPPRA